MDSQSTPMHINEHTTARSKLEKNFLWLIPRHMHSLQDGMAQIWRTKLQIFFQSWKKELRAWKETTEIQYIGSSRNVEEQKSYYQNYTPLRIHKLMVLDLISFRHSDILAKTSNRMTTATKFSTGSQACTTYEWGNLVLVVVRVLESKGLC